MNPVLVIGAVFVVLFACGIVFDLRRRRLDAGRRAIGLEVRSVRGRAESRGEVGGPGSVQGHYGGGNGV
ncbi:MAG: hypothetical protein ACR2MP_11830 [Streptosporangiaceae bacterium]